MAAPTSCLKTLICSCLEEVDYYISLGIDPQVFSISKIISANFNKNKDKILSHICEYGYVPTTDDVMCVVRGTFSSFTDYYDCVTCILSFYETDAKYFADNIEFCLQCIFYSYHSYHNDRLKETLEQEKLLLSLTEEFISKSNISNMDLDLSYYRFLEDIIKCNSLPLLELLFTYNEVNVHDLTYSVIYFGVHQVPAKHKIYKKHVFAILDFIDNKYGIDWSHSILVDVIGKYNIYANSQTAYIKYAISRGFNFEQYLGNFLKDILFFYRSGSCVTQYKWFKFLHLHNVDFRKERIFVPKFKAKYTLDKLKIHNFRADETDVNMLQIIKFFMENGYEDVLKNELKILDTDKEGILKICSKFIK
jgi:hypothetical protein